jgi:hypothetical protein
MVIGGIGYCDIQNNFRFHRNVIEGLQIYNGSILYGVYYPWSKDTEKIVDNIRYHFMLTPIPDKVWPRTARLVIRLNHEDTKNANNEVITTDGQTQGIQPISKYLAEHGVAIIYSFSNRSGHRYSTWDIHVCFDKIFKEKHDYDRLIKEYEEVGEKIFESHSFAEDVELAELTNNDIDNSFDETKSYFKEIFILSKWISYLINKKYANVESNNDNRLLWSDPDDVDLKDTIVTRVNTSCHYFYFISRQRRDSESDQSKKKAYEVFTVRYNSGWFKPDEPGIINVLIKTLQPEITEFQLPSICFAEADSHYLNLRLIIIPNEMKHLFFKVSIFHERISDGGIYKNNTSRGLLSLVTQQFPKDQYKIWKSSILLFEDRKIANETYCNGKLSLFLQSKTEFDEKDVNDRVKMLNDKLASLNNINKGQELQHVRLIGRCEKVFPDLLRRYFHIPLYEQEVHEKHEYPIFKRRLTKDVFISYSTADLETAKKLRDILEQHGCCVYFADTATNTGNILSDEIQNGMYTSREFCVLFTPKSIRSNWVTTEWGAAWALKLFPYTPILANGVTYEKISKKFGDRISKHKCIVWPSGNDSDVIKYAKKVYMNRFESLLYLDNYEYQKGQK